MTTLKNDRFLRALKRQAVDRTPVWIMRQAGRYLPEYRKVRAEAGSFMSLCTHPELACEVTLQPLRRFPLDAAILFSDILTIPDAMGLGLYFIEGEGPKFERTIDSPADVTALPRPDPNESLSYVMDAVSLIRKELAGEVPLIGFSGSPWTLATYMVEGGSSKSFGKVKAMLYDQPEAAHALLGKLLGRCAWLQCLQGVFVELPATNRSGTQCGTRWDKSAGNSLLQRLQWPPGVNLRYPMRCGGYRLDHQPFTGTKQDR